MKSEELSYRPTLPVERPDLRTASAWITMAAAVLFLVLLAALHFLKPDLDPSWHFISEYGTGAYGWVMTLAFLSLAVSCAAAFVAVRSEVRTLGGKIGLALLLIAAAALAGGGIFAMDPLTTRPEDATLHGRLHGLAGMIGIPALAIAPILISRSLLRHQSWTPARRSLRWTAHLTWITLVLMDAALFITLSRNDGQFGPGVWIGWPNRLLVAVFCAWLIIAGRQAWRLIPNSKE